MRRARWAVAVVGLLLLTAAGCGTRASDQSASPVSFIITPEGGIAGGGAAGDTGSAAGPASAGGATGGTGAAATGGSGAFAGSATAGGAGGAQGSTSGPATGDPIVLGAVGTRSGIVGSALEGSWRGLAVWKSWVNAHGGIQGRPVQVITVDDGGDPGKHAAAVRQLIFEDHVVAFIGDFAPFTESSGIPLLEQYGIPTIGGDGGDQSWFASPMAFPINGQTVSRGRPIAKWVLANRAERKAAVFYVSEAAAPKVLADNFVAAWQAGGGAVVVNAGVSLAQPDFTSEVLQAKSAGADAIYLVLEKSGCNRFFDAARRQSYGGIFLTSACTIDTAIDAKDITTNRLFSVSSSRPIRLGSSPAEDEALQAVAQYDPDLSPDGAFEFAWLGGKLLEAAMAQPGAVMSSAGIVDALHRLPATDLGGLTPQQAWPPGPHAEVGCGMITEFDGQQLQLQTPEFVC